MFNRNYIMDFSFKCFCFSWILSYVCIAVDDISKCPAKKFGLIKLSHSSLLVSWNPEQVERYAKWNFTWYPYPHKKNLQSNHSEIDPKKYSQFKIPSLQENTNYRIDIIDIGNENRDFCWIIGKTSLKINDSLPTKPDFEFFIDNNYSYFDLPSRRGAPHACLPMVKIEWLPCGRKRYCEEEEVAGSHFSVKYKMLESRQEWRTSEYDKSHKFIFGLLPGRIYEMVVTSIISVGNVDLKTESDPQEVFIVPRCSPVRSVKIITLSDLSIIISWMPPKQCQLDDPKGIIQYAIFYSIFDNSSTIFLNYSDEKRPHTHTSLLTFRDDVPNFTVGSKKVSDLINGTCYTFFIIPWNDFNPPAVFGFEYRIDYTIHQTDQVNLPLAKPEFLGTLRSSESSCWLEVVWFPCGKTFDCNITKPGSHFLVTLRNMNDGEEKKHNETKSERTMVYTGRGIERNQKYRVAVQSGDKFGYSEFSEEQIIDTSKCPKRKQ